MNLPSQRKPVQRTASIQSSVAGDTEAPLSAVGLAASENGVVASNWIDDLAKVANIAAPYVASLF